MVRWSVDRWNSRFGSPQRRLSSRPSWQPGLEHPTVEHSRNPNAERTSTLKLSDKRQKLYAEVLEPFLIAITPDIVWNTDPETKGKDKQQLLQEAMLNMRYRQAMFQLTFIGTDEVVEALNDLMQHFYRAGADPQQQAAHGAKLARLLAKFLLAIRKGAGNDATRLDKWAMLEPFMTDAREQRDRERRGH